MAFSNQYGGVPQIHPASSGARMMMEALSSASTGQSKNFFSLAGELGKIGANFWQDYNDNDARQAMMQYTDSKELQDAIASGKLDLSETSTKFQKEASEHIKGLADTKLAQVNAEKNQYEFTKEQQHEEAMTKAAPIINEMRRLMTTGSPADFQKAMELSLQIDDARILKEIGINPTEESRAERQLKINEQRANTEAYEANLRAKKLDLEIKDKEEAQAIALAQKYLEQGITPMTGEGADILKEALGPYYDRIFPMGYKPGGEDAAKDIGTASATAYESAKKELDLSRQKLEAFMGSNSYTKSFESLNDDAKASLDKSIKGEDMIGLSKTIIEQTLGLSEKDLRHEEVAQFAADVQKVYREAKKENYNITLKDVAAVMLNSNRAFEKNADIIGGSIGNGYYDFKTGFTGLGFKFNPQAFKEELLESVKSNELSNQVDSINKELDALESELQNQNILAAQAKAIAGHAGSVDAKRKEKMLQDYEKTRQKIIKKKAQLEAELEEVSGRKLSK